MAASHLNQSGPPIQSEFAGDADMTELVNLFVDELPGRIKAIQDALGAARLDELARLTHQLKGASGGYGFPQIGSAAGVVEQSIRQGPDPASRLAQIHEQVRSLVDMCARVRV